MPNQRYGFYRFVGYSGMRLNSTAIHRYNRNTLTVQEVNQYSNSQRAASGYYTLS